MEGIEIEPKDSCSKDGYSYHCNRIIHPRYSICRFLRLATIVEDMKQPSPENIKENIKEYVVKNEQYIRNVISEIDALEKEVNVSEFGPKISGIGHTAKTTYIDEVNGLHLNIDDPSLGWYYEEIDNEPLEKLLTETFIDGIDILDNGFSFECGGVGIGSETTYYGFLYSSSDLSDILQDYTSSEDAALVPEENGYIWEEPDEDNYFYIENIVDNFYFYEQHF